MKKVSKIFFCAIALLLFWNNSQANNQDMAGVNLFESQAPIFHNVEIVKSKSLAPSCRFNGIDSHIELEEHFDSTFSFCAWIKPGDLLKKNMAIVGIPNAFWLRTTTTRELQFTQPGVQDDNTEGLLLSADNWIFVSFVIEFPSTKIYLNAELVGEFQWNGNKTEWKNRVLIGKDKWREDFDGSMQNIQIFKNAIHENTIKQLFGKRPYLEATTDGIVFYHSFNSTKKYYSSTQITQTSNVGFLNDSLRGTVATFNGKDSYIDFGELAIDNGITISVWVKQNEFNRDYGAIVAFGHAYAFRITTGGALLFTIPQMADVWDVNARLAPNKWQHIAVTFKEQHGVTYYLNGEKTGFFEEEKYQAVPKELQIGTNLWNDFYKGQLDDLVVWNKVLNEKEIKTVYEKNDEFWRKNIKTTHKLSLLFLLVALGALIALIIIFVILKQRKKQKTALEKPDPFQQKINEIVLENLADSSFSVKEFAEAMNMSKTKLYNEVKASVGQSPKEYIREFRLNEAARILTDTNVPVTEIVYETGFESRAYFNKCFKAKFNATPTEYRKMSL